MPDTIPPHQQRVIDEKTALDDLRTKLGTFIESNPIFKDLDPAEQERLLRQIGAMTAYSLILGERITAFTEH